MIKKLLSLGFAFLVSCSLLADTHSYMLTWTANTEPDMSHYEVYVWTGLDTLVCPLIQDVGISPSSPLYLKDVGHPDELTSFVEIADGVTYIRAGLVAVDIYGNRSGLGVSNFLLSPDNTPPATPQNVTLQ